MFLYFVTYDLLFFIFENYIFLFVFIIIYFLTPLIRCPLIRLPILTEENIFLNSKCEKPHSQSTKKFGGWIHQ